MTDLNATHDVPAGRIAQIGLSAVARPAPGVALNELVRKMRDLGNPILDVADGAILVIEQTYDVPVVEALDPETMISFDPLADFEAHELLWSCDYCRAHSRSKAVIVEHERTVHGA